MRPSHDVSQGQAPYSGKAIAALACVAAAAVFVVPVVAAVPLGWFALRDIRRGDVRGRWIAATALAGAGIVIALWILYGLSFLVLDTP